MTLRKSLLGQKVYFRAPSTFDEAKPYSIDESTVNCMNLAHCRSGTIFDEGDKKG